MSTSIDYMDFVKEQIHFDGEIRYKTMFGEYMVYVNNKPIFMVCNSTIYVKKLDCIEHLMADSACGIPYEGSREQYILDIEDTDLSTRVIEILEKVVPVPKPKKKSVARPRKRSVKK